MVISLAFDGREKSGHRPTLIDKGLVNCINLLTRLSVVALPTEESILQTAHWESNRTLLLGVITPTISSASVERDHQ